MHILIYHQNKQQYIHLEILTHVEISCGIPYSRIIGPLLDTVGNYVRGRSKKKTTKKIQWGGPTAIDLGSGVGSFCKKNHTWTGQHLTASTNTTVAFGSLQLLQTGPPAANWADCLVVPDHHFGWHGV